jgi:hypothetical protein
LHAASARTTTVIDPALADLVRRRQDAQKQIGSLSNERQRPARRAARWFEASRGSSIPAHARCW